MRAAYLIDRGPWYLKPLIDFNATYVDLDGFSEKGGAGSGLFVRHADETVLSVSPAIELGGEIGGSSGSILRPFIRAGVTVLDGTDFQLTSGFLGAPAGVAPFRINADIDEVIADVSAGLDVIAKDGVVLRLQYEGRFSENTEEHSAGVKVSLKF